MKTKYLAIFSVIGIGGVGLFFPAMPVYASLGGDTASIETDRQGLQGQEKVRAQLHVQKRTGYSLHEITVDGTQVQEYASASGTVFAIAWRGTTEPDLTLLLGKYYGDYEHALAEPERLRARGPRIMHAKNMVVERSGHMRDLRGRAYLTDLLPAGFDVKDFK